MSDFMARVEAARTRRQVRAIMASTSESNIAEQFFVRVAQLAGESPGDCARVARLADLVRVESHRDRAFVLRTQAVGKRAIGRWLSAAQLFEQAGELLKGAERWTFSVGAIDSYARAGSTEEAVRYGRKALGALRKRPDIAARVRLNLGNAYAWRDRNQEAIAEYEAALLLLDPELKWERAIAHLGVSTANLLSGSPQRAMEMAGQARDGFTEVGATYHANLAEINVAQANLQLGCFDLAVTQLLELSPRFSDSPADLARMHEFLGDAYARLNLLSESEQAYRDALSTDVLRDMPLNLANCEYGLASLIGRQNGKEAARLLRKAAKGYRKAGNRAWELASAARASIQSGVPITQVQELRSIGATYLAEETSILAAEAGGGALSPPTSPLLEWRYALILARRQPAISTYRDVFDLIERDRLALSNPNSALHFLDDRGQAVLEYIDLLLAEDQINAALNVVARTRSAALIDEIEASRGAALSGEALAELDRFKSEFLRDSSPGSRLRASTDLAGSTRAWIEATWTTRTKHAENAVSMTDGDVWIEGSGVLRRIRKEGVYRPKIGSAELCGILNWLEFFLFEPMINRDACPDSCRQSIDQLRRDLGEPSSIVCPDGPLWRVPWTLLAEEEVSLNLSPALGCSGLNQALDRNPSVAVWAAHSDDLPSLHSEISDIVAAFPSAVVLESRSEIRNTYGASFDLIHVAGHARIDKRKPAFSFIDFADGPLYAAEIARSGLRTDVAIVAACQSGVSSTHQSFEPEGLVRSFLACGSKIAIGSLWPLDDEFMYHFTSALYPLLRDGQTLGIAMSKARRQCRDKFPHPYFWGSLATFGGYR